MIPTLSRRDIRAALHRLRGMGMDERRASTRFCLALGGRHYPPKHVISLAVEERHGRRLTAQEFSGGNETNSLLTGMGFDVVKCSCGGAVIERGGSANRMETCTVGRVIVDGRPTSDDSLASAERMLFHVLARSWPRNRRVKFLITPGGFVTSTAWPARWSGHKGWESRASDLPALIAAGQTVLGRVVSKRVLTAASGKVEVLTIGIDIFGADGQHVELIAVLEIASGDVHWTGKSYPTSGQQALLVQVVDLGTHLLRIAGERVLVLGCHDLNMFSPRGRAAQEPTGNRRRVCDSMASKVRGFKPTIVLQHPHTTDTPNIWRMPWLSLLRAAPSVRAWASGIDYYNGGKRRRAPMARVLELTRGQDPTLDIMIRAPDFEG